MRLASRGREERKDGMIYVCSVPAVPPSFNEYDRWCLGRKLRAKQEWQHMLGAVLNEKGNRCPRAPQGFARIELKSVICFTTGRRRDGDNYGMPLWKWTQDVLVSYRVIPDDSREHCLVHAPGFALAKEPRTLITIEAADNPKSSVGEEQGSYFAAARAAFVKFPAELFGALLPSCFVGHHPKGGQRHCPHPAGSGRTSSPPMET